MYITIALANRASTKAPHQPSGTTRRTSTGRSTEPTRAHHTAATTTASGDSACRPGDTAIARPSTATPSANRPTALRTRCDIGSGSSAVIEGVMGQS